MLSFRKKISSEKTLKLLVFFADLNDYTHKIKVDILFIHKKTDILTAFSPY